jgi:hypothetical protein
MPTVRRTLVGILRDLAALEQRYALVGGLAVSARTEPRTTRDVDIAVAVDDDSAAEALIFALQQRGYSVAAVIEWRKRPPLPSSGSEPIGVAICRVCWKRRSLPGGAELA